VAAKVIKIQEWLDCFKEATNDLAKSSLRFDGVPPRETPGKGEQANPGTYIAIMTDSSSMHLGITSTPQGVRVLARGLLGLRQDQELSDQEAVDGVSEMMNIVAGKVKSKMASRDGTLQLGLPMFVQTPIQVNEQMERASADVTIGPVACQLLVFRNRRAA
jgi:hypothetical protein